MKKHPFILLLFLGYLSLSVVAQNNSIITIQSGESLELTTDARGEVTWEHSADNTHWFNLEGGSGASLTLNPKKSGWYRGKISEGDCEPVNTDPTYVNVIDASARKNIILILVDDMGWRDLNSYGSDFYETPNIDRIATNGVKFSNAYSAHPVCSPTRASLATGQYPARLHLTSYIPGPERDFAKLKHPEDWTKYLKMSELTYAEALKAGGYLTFHAGKWHLGRLSPIYHGFDGIVADLNHSEGSDDPKNDLLYTNGVIDFIEANKDTSFLAVISHNNVHVPLETSAELESKYEAKVPGSFGQDNPTMAGMIEQLDVSVGLLLDKLEELKLMDKTYIIFFSDNGGLNSATSNKPLRGGKSQIYEGGIKVPFLVMGPRLPVGHVVSYPVISNDLFPTMLDMAGLDLMPEAHQDGISLMPLLTGEQFQLEERPLYFHYPHYQTLPPHSAILYQDWKLIKHYEDGLIELFDLSSDPEESSNLASVFPGRRDDMLQLLDDHLAEIGAQLPEDNPDYDAARASESHQGDHDPAEFQQPEYLNWNN